MPQSIAAKRAPIQFPDPDTLPYSYKPQPLAGERFPDSDTLPYRDNAASAYGPPRAINPPAVPGAGGDIPLIPRPRPAIGANVRNPQVAVDTLLRATGGDYNTTHAAQDDPMSAANNPAFHGDSVASQLNRQRYMGQQQADISEDQQDYRAQRDASRNAVMQPQEEDSADMTSERGAFRALGPAAGALFRRNRGAAIEDSVNRYQIPAHISGQATRDAADIAGTSRIEAAGINNQFDPRKAMMDALTRAAQSQISGDGTVDPAALAVLEKFLGNSMGNFK